ncbi:hypothetical protein ACHAQJ_006185 [Trichoderma viride]
MAGPKHRREEYYVGWVCALPIELAAAELMLDEEHPHLEQAANDTNLYTFGRIGDHNVVIACLPAGQMGTNSAAAVAMQMKSQFPSLRFGLMVGIGGGVPSEDVDIRLGDVIVSSPQHGHGGVVQYDFGKSTPNGFTRTGFLNTPPTILLNAVSRVQAKYARGRSELPKHLAALEKLPAFQRNKAGTDTLYKADYNHEGGPTCARCRSNMVVDREPRDSGEVIVHYGTIASGNQVMREGATRDEVSSLFGGVLCFEMEAAGLMNCFPSLAIRGICDYSDSHKSKRWQAYAAGTAAAYAKDLLSAIPATQVTASSTIEEAVAGESRRGHSVNVAFGPNNTNAGGIQVGVNSGPINGYFG